MPVVVVGGGAKDIGKTALVCAVIAALREFGWTAVKVTGHDYDKAGAGDARAGVGGPAIWEETQAGQETDTERYLAAGARRALLVTRYGAEVPVEEIRTALGSDRNVIFESNRIVDVVRPDVCLALVGGAESEMKPSFERLLRAADAVVSVRGAWMRMPELRGGVRQFELANVEQLSAEMAGWLRERLDLLPHADAS